jgi:hypothetical protein
VVIWLASYPRSGNTLARLILAHAFDCKSASEYDERPTQAAVDGRSAASDLTTAEAAERIGLPYDVQRDGAWPEFRAAAQAAGDPVVIKTHGPPLDDSRAIYVVRDGRAAIMSHFHFIHRYGGASALSVADVVLGAGGFGSWSDHLSAWSPLDRPGTLLLRYGTFVHHPELAIDALAQFLGRPPLASWKNPFARLQQFLPDFFRAGSDAWNVAEWSASDLSLFWERHGAWMKRLGYAS